MKRNDYPQDPRITSGNNFSYWTDTVRHLSTNVLKENLTTDVVIVGGGLAGLSTAYCLAQSGKQVVVVEDGQIGSGETGRTTAHLVTALDDRYYHLESVFNEEKTKLIAESHRVAIDFVEDTVLKEKIDCGFERVDGYLFLHPSDKPDSLERELAATLKAGLPVDFLQETPALLQKQSCIRFLQQAQFHPLKYLMGLAKAIEQKGGKIFTGTHAEMIDHEGITTVEGFHVKANHIVVATNSPVNNLFTMFEKEYAYRTYVIGALIPKDSVPKALWWDTGDFTVDNRLPPYHYVRVHPYNEQHDLLISGGEDHPIGNTKKTNIPEEERYGLLENWTRQYFPIEKIIYQWSGQVLEPMDGVAFIGRNPHDHDNVYIITGDSGNGMTHCSFAGLLITDLINGKENKWEEIYKPSRFTLTAAAPMLRQMATEMMSFLKQMPNFNNTDELASVKLGEGRIVKMLEEEFGVYRDLDGVLHIVSAKCSHLKCSIVWNADELSWDCPCHGSRFSYDGKVMNGPANYNLPAYQYHVSEDHVTLKS